MIKNIPTSQDYFFEGKELLNFSWDIIADLLVNFHDAEEYLCDIEEISEGYWNAAKRRITSALSTVQQGIEFIIKGKIASISPFLLISDQPSRWPKAKNDKIFDFNEFRSLDSQDLVNVHDIFSDKPLDSDIVEIYESLRKTRNKIMHSLNRNLSIQVTYVVEILLFMHKKFFPNETWGQIRCEFLNTSPNSEIYSNDYTINQVCKELSVVFKLLSPAKIKNFFGINIKQKLYFCPKCYDEAYKKFSDFEFKLGVLNQPGKKANNLYCPVCNKFHDIILKKCSECQNEIFSKEYDLCLTCGS